MFAEQGSERARDYNRGFGADANFRFFGDLTVNVAGREERDADRAHARRRATTGIRRAAFGYRDNFWEARGDVPDDRRRASTTRWGSCRASASTTSRSISARTSGRRGFQRWMRETFPHIQIENFTRRNGGGLESRYMDWHWPITLPEQHVHRDRRQPEHRSDRRALHDQQPPRTSTSTRAATSSRRTSCSPTPTRRRRSR